MKKVCSKADERNKEEYPTRGTGLAFIVLKSYHKKVVFVWYAVSYLLKSQESHAYVSYRGF